MRRVNFMTLVWLINQEFYFHLRSNIVKYENKNVDSVEKWQFFSFIRIGSWFEETMSIERGNTYPVSSNDEVSNKKTSSGVLASELHSCCLHRSYNEI